MIAGRVASFSTRTAAARALLARLSRLSAFAAVAMTSTLADAGPTKTVPAAATAPTADDATTGRNVSPPRSTVSLGDDLGKGTGGGLVPPTHTVRKGDTLWDLCDAYFHNPWQWPRVWSYNPDILNPHWIFPGEVIRLRRDAPATDPTASTSGLRSGREGMVLRPRSVPTGTVFVRNFGFIYDDKVENGGEIVGSPEERMILTPYNTVYVRVTPEQAKTIDTGDALTVFNLVRPVRKGKDQVGQVVQILGTVRVEHIDRDSNLVDGTIIEALDVIERGARVGPLDRKIDVVPAKTNDAELRGVLLTSIRPNVLYGAQQMVLLDKGEDDGLRVGNRIFVVRKGDPWRSGLAATGDLAASKLDLGSEDPAPIDKVDTPADAPDFPEEVVAEIRVIRVRKGTATAIVTRSDRELEPGDAWLLKKGY